MLILLYLCDRITVCVYFSATKVRFRSPGSGYQPGQVHFSGHAFDRRDAEMAALSKGLGLIQFIHQTIIGEYSYRVLVTDNPAPL